ncbi:glycosyltransferase family 2 protein [Pseudaquabacterium rugosum]|uniref:Glycosyltransferase family 2 protein n=1 Tax=Pseudaquabacterium rugosum TaxID=2984194 RepID=A0ABU9B7T0_9BURK
MNEDSASPKFSVIVSSYNYADFVVDAVNSALRQSHPPHQVIVVDDGSKDLSFERLQAAFHSDPKVTLIRQENGGQMAAWMTGFSQCTGDWVGFLDSDDLWRGDFIACILKTAQSKPDADFIFCNMEKFGENTGRMLTKSWHKRDRDLGTSILLGCYSPRWQGVATSGNAIKVELLSRILELPPDQVKEWKTRPDDCLFYGADILGGRKLYLARELALHREHGSNALLLEKQSSLKRLKYEFRREKMMAFYRSQISESSRLKCLAHVEFRTKESPTFAEFMAYVKIAWAAPEALNRRLRKSLQIAQHYFLEKIH